MTHQEKLLLTICGYLSEDLTLKSSKDLLEKLKVDNYLLYLKDNFSNKLSEAEKLLLKINRDSIGAVCIWEDFYPENLRSLPNPPSIIFYKGNPELLKNKILAVIGTRKASSMGISYAKTFTKELVSYFTIASGMAYGIDSAASNTSVDLGYGGVVVLPGSLINPYPVSNRYLFNKILNNNGLVISEHPYLDPLYKSSFIIRNRIIAGISDSILMIESPSKGGSLTTCKIGIDNNRHIYTLPANISLVSFEGNNNLIKYGIASLVTSPGDLLDLRDRKLYFNKTRNFSYEEKLVLDAIKDNSQFDTIYISLKDKLEFNKVYDIMLNLEMNGIIAKELTGLYRVI